MSGTDPEPPSLDAGPTRCPAIDWARVADERAEWLGKFARGEQIDGHCYDWALMHLTDTCVEDAELVHGTVVHPNDIELGPHGHAWIEWNGRVFDFQTVVLGRVLGTREYEDDGWPLDQFIARYQAVGERRYTFPQVLGTWGDAMHYGPWH